MSIQNTSPNRIMENNCNFHDTPRERKPTYFNSDICRVFAEAFLVFFRNKWRAIIALDGVSTGRRNGARLSFHSAMQPQTFT
ncbi:MULTISPECIES: hypothetical protein [Rhizobium]|uniref:Uncharacterized protein n=1 Tax=Rhizobium paranaense TaxID=1650438 RepID=A0A7W9CZI2_9HYPH|nr:MULTISPECIES: hypothetical protein [Rhizobium]MBB5572254.1 hypothetical protein [Rhizobium paranaense]